MEAQERLTGDIREAEARFKQRENEGRSQEATAREQLRAVEAELAGVRTERKELAGQLPGPILADYDRILRARAGVALVPVAKPNFCGACRMTITPQRLQELRAQASLIPCESCGRYLYWPS
jgi:predicted  nucleic acid-binding Zn-ribbon protein